MVVCVCVWGVCVSRVGVKAGCGTWGMQGVYTYLPVVCLCQAVCLVIPSSGPSSRPMLLKLSLPSPLWELRSAAP